MGPETNTCRKVPLQVMRVIIHLSFGSRGISEMDKWVHGYKLAETDRDVVSVGDAYAYVGIVEMSAGSRCHREMEM